MKNETRPLIILVPIVGFMAGVLFGISVHLKHISDNLKIIASPPVTEIKSE